MTFSAQALFSAVKAKSFGCCSGGARRRLAMDISTNRFAIARRDVDGFLRLGDHAEEHLVALDQEQARARRGRDRACEGEAVLEQRGNARLLGECARRNSAERERDDEAHDHRSTSPNTISSEPRIADTSASMWPRHMKSIACRCAKPGARILH